MHKDKFFCIFALGFFVLFGIMISSSCFAQEEVTITTYYPSPHGVYDELQSQKSAVGDTDGDNQLTTADLPNRDGDIRIKPQTGDPATWPAGQPGQIAYSADNETLYYWNSTTSQWVGGVAGTGSHAGWGIEITCTAGNPGAGSPIYPVSCASGGPNAGMCGSCGPPWWSRGCSCAVGTLVRTGKLADTCAGMGEMNYVTCVMP
ncbi:hypothetical protein ACFL1D_05650 [Candidatus Omnitrophota bacterium]